MHAGRSRAWKSTCSPVLPMSPRLQPLFRDGVSAVFHLTNFSPVVLESYRIYLSAFFKVYMSLRLPWQACQSNILNQQGCADHVAIRYAESTVQWHAPASAECYTTVRYSPVSRRLYVDDSGCDFRTDRAAIAIGWSCFEKRVGGWNRAGVAS